MKLISFETKTLTKEYRVCDFYRLDGKPPPEFCNDRNPFDVVRLEVLGYEVVAVFQKDQSERIPGFAKLPNGLELQCVQCDRDGRVKAVGYFGPNDYPET